MTWTHSLLDIFLYNVPLDVKEVLDIGCGRGIVGALLRIYREPQTIVGIDIFDPYLDFCRRSGVYDRLVKHDLRNTPLPFKTDHFDLSVALEVVEHLPKTDGMKLLEEMERVSKHVIVSTPNRNFVQSGYDENPHQTHMSKWTVSDLSRRGYRVLGAGGLMLFGREVRYLSYALGRLTLPFPRLSSYLLGVYLKTQFGRR